MMKSFTVFMRSLIQSRCVLIDYTYPSENFWTKEGFIFINDDNKFVRVFNSMLFMLFTFFGARKICFVGRDTRTEMMGHISDSSRIS